MRIRAFLLTASIICLSPIEAFSGAWTLPKGRLWVKSAIFYQATDSRFCTDQDALSSAFQEVGCTSAGHSAPFDPFVGGTFKALAIFTEMVYGATGWLDLGIQVPFYSLQFTNLSDPNRPRSNSIGDVRFFGKSRLFQAPLVASITVGAKSPIGKYDIDAEAVNVSEGQWDVEFLGEVSRSLWPLAGYLNLGVGYRIRADNDAFLHTVENEFTAIVEAGYSITRRVMIKGMLDWLRGQRPRLKSTGRKILWRRELRTLAPSIIYTPSKDMHLEASIRFPIGGQDFPDGPQISGAVSYSFFLPQ